MEKALSCMKRCGKTGGTEDEYEFQKGGRVMVCKGCADTMRSPEYRESRENEMLYGAMTAERRLEREAEAAEDAALESGISQAGAVWYDLDVETVQAGDTIAWTSMTWSKRPRHEAMASGREAHYQKTDIKSRQRVQGQILSLGAEWVSVETHAGRRRVKRSTLTGRGGKGQVLLTPAQVETRRAAKTAAKRTPERAAAVRAERDAKKAQRAALIEAGHTPCPTCGVLAEPGALSCPNGGHALSSPGTTLTLERDTEAQSVAEHHCQFSIDDPRREELDPSGGDPYYVPEPDFEPIVRHFCTVTDATACVNTLYSRGGTWLPVEKPRMAFGLRS